MAGAEPAGDIASAEGEAEAVRSEIASMNAELQEMVENYNYASYQLSEIETSISENEAMMAEASANLAEAQARLEERIQKIYKNGSVEILDVLMETSDLTDFLTKFDMLTKVGEQDRDDAEQIKMLKEQIEEAQTQLEEDQVNQEALLGEIAAEQSSIEASIAERNSALSGIEDQIAALEAEQEAARQAQLQVEVASYSESETYYGGGGGGPTPAPSYGNAADIAMQYLGVPYVWGGASPAGFDCSGLVMYVYAQLGISLPHSAAAQYGYGTPISYSELAPGDLVFFGGGGISHVGIYIGGGSMVHAPYPGAVVSVSSVSGGGSYRGACRL